MNGYLAPYAPDPGTRLAFRSAQCALCHHLGEEYGTIYRLLAGPDMVFLALLREVAAGAEATLYRRACVAAPLVTRLPVRADSPAIRYAAAAGVYLAVEKLRDDWEDERSWLKGLAWRALRPGQARAREVLAEAGLDLAAVDAELQAQSAIERGAESDLEVAAGPTRRLAATFFSGGAGPATAALSAIGAHVGDYLFWMDGLLDLPRDLRTGAYNALARAFSLGSPAVETHQAARDVALDRASRAVDALSEAVAALPAHSARPALHRSVVLGFRDKLRRYRHLDTARLPDATLGDLLPPRTPVTHTLGLQLARARDAVPLRFRMALAFLLVWFFPRAAWAAGWWPAGADPGLDGPDTGAPVLPAGHADTGLFAVDGDCGNLCDPCASNCGWFSCEPNCDQVCGNACDSACSDACSG